MFPKTFVAGAALSSQFYVIYKLKLSPTQFAMLKNTMKDRFLRFASYGHSKLHSYVSGNREPPLHINTDYIESFF